MSFLKDNWWYILILGGIVFMMARGGGCCGGSMHGNHSGHGGGGGCCGGEDDDTGHGHDHSNPPYQPYMSQQNTLRDPVCGMSVNPDTAIRGIVNGQAYYFCSESCRREFLQNQRYSG